MKLYNTLTKSVDEVKPINNTRTTVYTCGPTVYDFPHIGNWFTFIRYDILIRTLKLLDLKPDWVLNITDVGHLVSDADDGEDKLVKGASREGKTAQEVADRYTKYFITGLKRLNITEPNYLPKATEHIDEQINLIKILEQKGFTYVIDDGVYYDTSKFPKYSEFANLELDELREGARVAVNQDKHNPTDFALWKFSPKDSKRDMEWDSPWGTGFPGWHIECSAMSMKYLGETIDIHAGGIDHIPVHHTNEIAQSEAANDKVFAHYWMHTNHITVDGSKIAKSEGNGITLEDIEKQGYSIEALRLLVLGSHYRNQSQFSWGIMKDAEQTLKNLVIGFSWIYSVTENAESHNEALKNKLAEIKDNILDMLSNDLDTPKALVYLYSASLELSRTNISNKDIAVIEEFGDFINRALGLNILKKITLSEEQMNLMKKRAQARKDGNWEVSDKIRDELATSGIGVNDLKDKTIWFPL